MNRYVQPFTPLQTEAVSLIAAIARNEIPAANRILSTTTDLRALAVYCASICAYGSKPHVWDTFVAAIAHAETEQMFSPVPAEGDDPED